MGEGDKIFSLLVKRFFLLKLEVFVIDVDIKRWLDIEYNQR